jgi:chromate transporter
MIFLKLFLVFSYIGLFNFGGGYAMLSFIQQEVVQKYEWLTESEFTDIVAISQSTPGPIGINCATYTGYTAVINEGWPWWMGVFGSVLASLSVLWLPFIVMIWVSKIILRYKDSIVTKSIFAGLRPAIIGLLASAALSLMNEENFGSPSEDSIQFAISILMFVVVFAGMFMNKLNIIYTTFACGFLGLILYGVMEL